MNGRTCWTFTNVYVYVAQNALRSVSPQTELETRRNQANGYNMNQDDTKLSTIRSAYSTRSCGHAEPSIVHASWWSSPPLDESTWRQRPTLSQENLMQILDEALEISNGISILLGDK
jgi:hypothetical protein